jgi:uncharacterized protein (DUF433 family)
MKTHILIPTAEAAFIAGLSDRDMNRVVDEHLVPDVLFEKTDGVRRVKDGCQADALVTVSPDVMGGAAVFAGTRVPIDIVLGSIAADSSMERLRASYPFLTDAHVQAARVYEAVHPRRGRPRRLADTNPAMKPHVRRVVRPAATA